MQQSTTKENWNKIIQLKNWFWLFCFSYSVILLCDFAEKLFTYFQCKEIPKEESLTAACESWKENPPECIIVEEFENVQKNLQVDKLQNKKHVFGEKEKQEIAEFTSEQFLNLTESTIWPRDKTQNENLKEKKKPNNEVALKICQTGGMSLLLDVGLDSKPQAMIISLRMAGAGINQHVVRGVLIGLVKPYPEKFGKYDKISLSTNEILMQGSYHLKTNYYLFLVEWNQDLVPSQNFIKSITAQHSWWADQKCRPDSFKIICDW